MIIMKAVVLLFVITYSLVSVQGVERRQGDLSNPDNQRIQLIESERIEEYHKRNYTWPLTNYVPNTPGWKSLMEERFRQVAELDSPKNRYDGYIQLMNTALLVPNFTQHGFGLAKCPDDLLAALQQGIRDGIPTAGLEQPIGAIDTPNGSLFIDRPDLTHRVLQELRHYAETWAQIPLTPYRAYGFRAYQNQSQLYMHVDKIQTHIISFILHIDSSEDADPWPIFIEDFHGRTHEVILTPGDMLFYESSKCFHGRPKRLNGSWYSSVFVHYYPKYGWFDQNHELEAHYAVPPHWGHAPPAVKQYQPLELVGTAVKEPGCPNEWCRSQDTVKWSGPGEAGVWIAPTFEKYPFEPQEVIWNEEL